MFQLKLEYVEFCNKFITTYANNLRNRMTYKELTRTTDKLECLAHLNHLEILIEELKVIPVTGATTLSLSTSPALFVGTLSATTKDIFLGGLTENMNNPTVASAWYMSQLPKIKIIADEAQIDMKWYEYSK